MWIIAAPLVTQTPLDRVYLDTKGVIRWQSSRKEATFFGANYCLPSALDYRAAGNVGANRKKLVEQDLSHFARMGWNAIRYSFWGDWECCDAEGNLVPNDHLDLLDYTIWQAEKRGLYGLLSPIVTYDARWPEMKDYPAAIGFSKAYPREKLGTDPKAILAQQNYLRQLLNHINPYTGRALKDEPSIPFIEMINEPWHHPSNPEQAKSYVNALVEAVRSTGCKKLTFHNLSQDFGMDKILSESKVDGTTFGWYPTGLLANRELKGNFLPYVDRYEQWNRKPFSAKPKLVYEFDMGDVTSGYHYPAMTRTFRGFGAQYAAMFSYDMLATAPTNLGWTTHVLNMVYTPQKAAAAMISAEVMYRYPRNQPIQTSSSTTFGPFRVSFEEDLAELNAPDAFLYSNSTASRPISTAKLKRVAGFGSSPVVRYPGRGIYFLDRIAKGVWRLEVHPDVLQVADPYHEPKIDRICFRLIERTWPMGISLPELGTDFSLSGLNTGNRAKATAKDGQVSVHPGVYLLTAKGKKAIRLPSKVGPVGLREFVTPKATPVPFQALFEGPREHAVNEVLKLRATIVDERPPRQVHVIYDSIYGPQSFVMQPAGGYDYEVEIPQAHLSPGAMKFALQADPADPKEKPNRPEITIQMVSGDAPISLLDPAQDVKLLSSNYDTRAQFEPGESSFSIGPNTDARRMPEEIASQLTIGDRIRERNVAANALRLEAKGDGQVLRIGLVDTDGEAWTTTRTLSKEWQTLDIDLAELKPTGWQPLPKAFPGPLHSWRDAKAKGGKIDPRKADRLLFVMWRREQSTGDTPVGPVQFKRVELRR